MTYGSGGSKVALASRRFRGLFETLSANLISVVRILRRTTELTEERNKKIRKPRR